MTEKDRPLWHDAEGGMATHRHFPPWTLLSWPSLDSTNATAHRLLHQAATSSPHSPHSLHQSVLTTKEQTEGRGQQSRPWHGDIGADLAMSVILTRDLPAHCPFALNLAVSLAVLEGTEAALPQLPSQHWEIKWPNDLMLRGKKAGGILIENSWRGATWSSAVIGIGLNVGGTPPYPNAVRLIPEKPSPQMAGLHVDALRACILRSLDMRLAEMGHPDILLRQFHERLLGWGKAQRWQLDGLEIRGVLESIDTEGRLCVTLSNGQHQCFTAGTVGWLGLEPEG